MNHNQKLPIVIKNPSQSLLILSSQVFKPVLKIIHSIKYKKRFQTGIYFGKKFGFIQNENLTAGKFDYIIPVPLHPLKKAERGYNQSEYISKGISKASGIKFNCNVYFEIISLSMH